MIQIRNWALLGEVQQTEDNFWKDKKEYKLAAVDKLLR